MAKLHDFKTNESILCFKCEMGAGHCSKSGRFDRIKDMALELAFLLKTQSQLENTSALLIQLTQPPSCRDHPPSNKGILQL